MIEAVDRLAEADDPIPSHPFVNEGGCQRDDHRIQEYMECDRGVPQGDLLAHVRFRLHGRRDVGTDRRDGASARTLNHPRCAKFNPPAAPNELKRASAFEAASPCRAKWPPLPTALELSGLRVGSRAAPTLIRAILQAEFDRFADVLQSLVAGSALTDASWNNGALGFEVAVLPRSQNDR